MPRGVKGSKTVKPTKRAYEKRASKTNVTNVTDETNETNHTYEEIKNPMNELLEALSELVKEGVIALKRENAKHAPKQAAPAPVQTAAPAPAPAAAAPKPAKTAKPKAEPPAPVEDPLGDLGLEAAPKAPAMTEAESLSKIKSTAREYLDKFGEEKGVPAIRAIFKANFKTMKIPELTHDQRVKAIAILRDAIDA